MNTQLESVKDSIEEYFGNNGYDAVNLDGCSDLDDIETALYDFLWTEDDITGNASGSYFFNSYKAKEMVFENMETVTEALKEFCCGQSEEVADAFLNERWEFLDVTARCYVLGEAVADYVSENADELEQFLEA